MGLWLHNNWGTLLVCIVLLIIIGLILGKMFKDRRKGKSSCGCNCANCALQGQCHTKAKK